MGGKTSRVLSAKRDRFGRYHCVEKDPVTGLTLPAVVSLTEEGEKVSEWFIHGKHLRLDRDIMTGLSMPAEEYDDGTRAWVDEKGRWHRDEKDPVTGLTLPAVFYPNGSTFWFLHGKLKRTDKVNGVSLHTTVHSDGTLSWTDEKEDYLAHREEKDPVTGLTLPAVIDEKRQLRIWKIHGKFFRPEKHLPTFEGDQCNMWLDQSGRVHRTDLDPETGCVLPAKVYHDGRKAWYYNDLCVYEEKKSLLEKVDVQASHSLTLSKESTCPICLESIGGDCYITSCLHLTHKECLQKSEKRECPICREKL